MAESPSSSLDQLIAAADRALRTLAATPVASRPSPAAGVSEAGSLAADEARVAALYDAQALVARSPELRAMFEQAAREETDHLAWTQERISELGGRASLLNPLWYGGAFAIGLVAARIGDRASLGFMAETERQVEQHLQGHLERLPENDVASRAIVAQMKDDEVRHADAATALGGTELPAPVRMAMRLAARVMTRTAHYI
jgi:3-demethoxyubiquinol 3-hydroxylase